MEYKKIFHIFSFVVFLVLIAWTLYSPAIWGARQGDFTADFAWTIAIYFILLFAILAINFLMKLLNK